MAPNSKSDVKIVNTFGKFKKEINKEYIQSKAREMLLKEPKLTAMQMSKKLNVSESTFLRAFDERGSNPKIKNTIDELLKVGLKVGLGGLGVGILQNPEKLTEIAENLLSKGMENKSVVAFIGGLLLFWQKFVKVKIADQKNELSELEIFMKLMDSKALYVVLVGFGITLIPSLINMIENAVKRNKIFEDIDTFLDKVQELIPDEYSKLDLTIGGETFPNIVSWFVQHPLLLLNIPSGIVSYKMEKNAWIEKMEGIVAEQEAIIPEGEEGNVIIDESLLGRDKLLEEYT